MTSTLEENLLSSILPKVTIDNINLSSTSTGKLKINLKLVVKETLDNNFFGTWFDSVDIKKYVLINVVQCIDSRVTRALSFSNDMIKLCDVNTINKQDTISKAFGFILNETKIENIIKILKENTLTKTLSISRDSEGDNKIQKYSSYIDNDGNKIYEIPYNVDYELENIQPEHLSYFVTTKIDLKSFCSDYGINYNTAKNVSDIGKVYCETLIDNAEVVGVSYIYLDEKQQVWEGPVYQDSSGNWKTGNDENSPNSKKLTLTEVSNTKIQDFRNFADIEKKIFNFDNLENVLKKIYKDIKPQTVKSIFLNKTSINFSDFFISNNSSKTSTFAFGINFYNILKNNSKFSNLFYSNNRRFKQESIKNTKILNLTLLRRRVKNNIKLKSNASDYDLEKFDINESDFIVLNTKDKSWKNIIQVDNKKSSFAEVSLKTPEDTNQFIRFFTGTDKTFSDLTDGIYQYGIELEIEDGISKLMQEKISLLEQSKSKLIKYYNEIISTKDGYDLLTNKLNPKLVQKLYNTYLPSEKAIFSAPWVEPLSIFIDVLDIFSEDIKTERDRNLLIRSLCGYLSPQSANPQSILRMIQLFDQLISSIAKYSGITYSTLNASTSPPNGSGKSFKTLKTLYYFNQVIDSNISNNYGIDYLSTANPLQYSNKNAGLAVIDSSVYAERIENETLKYFKSLDLTLFMPLEDNKSLQTESENISYGYLSPTRIDCGSESTMLSPIQMSENAILLNGITSLRTLQDLDKRSDYSYLNLHTQIIENKLLGHKNTSSALTNNTKTNSALNKSDAALKKMQQQTANKIFNILSNVGNISMEPVSITYQKNEDGFIISDIEQKNINEKEADMDLNELYGFLSCFINPLMLENYNSGVRTVNNSNKLSSLAKKPIVDFTKQLPGIKLKESLGTKNKTFIGFKKPLTLQEINLIPNQLKGLISLNGNLNNQILNNLKYTDFRTNMLNKQINYYNFNMLVQVEYISGFSKLTGTDEININKPIWKILTKQVIEQMQNGEQIMCRIKSYSNSVLEVPYNKDVEQNCYNKHFIIINNSRRTAQRPIQVTPNIFSDVIIDQISKQIPDLEINVIPSSIRNNINNIIPEKIEVIKIDSNNIRQTTVIKTKKQDELIKLISNEAERTPVGEVSETSQIIVQTAILQLQDTKIKSSIKNTTFIPSTNINKNNMSIQKQNVDINKRR